jgi:hypothetical protein
MDIPALACKENRILPLNKVCVMGCVDQYAIVNPNNGKRAGPLSQLHSGDVAKPVQHPEDLQHGWVSDLLVLRHRVHNGNGNRNHWHCDGGMVGGQEECEKVSFVEIIARVDVRGGWKVKITTHGAKEAGYGR